MKGATTGADMDGFDESISIHAPVKGATLDGYRALRTDCISIHAPVKGSIAYGSSKWHVYIYFNPRSREGSDYVLEPEEVEKIAFQSTLLRRERPVAAHWRYQAELFQSTLP